MKFGTLCVGFTYLIGTLCMGLIYLSVSAHLREETDRRALVRPSLAARDSLAVSEGAQ